MVWSGFRPSDDACKFGFHIPGNMFASVTLEYAAEMARLVMPDEKLSRAAELLAADIRFGIETYGIVQHPLFGSIYAYETDGFGNYNLMDDANIPSLLSAPYLGFCAVDAPIYQNTRRFVLSEANPHYFRGAYAAGVGSAHTPGKRIWPLGLIMQGLTAETIDEQNTVLDMLLRTTAGTNFMHESFDPDDPAQFSREWFAWANSLFSELVLNWLRRLESER
jgi:meiotically up-regulated gene 157 (Mug157) protein